MTFNNNRPTVLQRHERDFGISGTVAAISLSLTAAAAATATAVISMQNSVQRAAVLNNIQGSKSI